MIQKLQINNFRGIKSGIIEDFTPLNVLVGKAGQGKSTILEAALLLASAPNVRNLHEVAHRRSWIGRSTWDYLLPAMGQKLAQSSLEFSIIANIRKENSESTEFTAKIIISRILDAKLIDSAKAEGITPDAQITFSLNEGKNGIQKCIAGVDGKISTPQNTNNIMPPFDTAIMLDLHSFMEPNRLNEILSSATVGGYLNEAIKYIRQVISEVTDLRLVSLDNSTIAMLYYGNGKPSIPIVLSGDGLRRIIELSLIALGGSPGLIVMEEPENFLHPTARKVCADIIWAAIQRGEQMIISTHNIEFIDDLLETEGSFKRDLSKLSLFRVNLCNNELVAHKISGQDALDAREILNQDLRV